MITEKKDTEKAEHRKQGNHVVGAGKKRRSGSNFARVTPKQAIQSMLRVAVASALSLRRFNFHRYNKNEADEPQISFYQGKPDRAARDDERSGPGPASTHTNSQRGLPCSQIRQTLGIADI